MIYLIKLLMVFMIEYKKVTVQHHELLRSKLMQIRHSAKGLGTIKIYTLVRKHAVNACFYLNSYAYHVCIGTWIDTTRHDKYKYNEKIMSERKKYGKRSKKINRQQQKGET